MVKSSLSFLMMFVSGWSSCALAGVISDGNFSTWNFGATGTAIVTREDNGGNPGGRLCITTISGYTVYGIAIKTDLHTISPLTGVSFIFSIDVLSGPGSYGQGQGIMFLVEQEGTIYGQDLGVTGYPRNFDKLSFKRELHSTAFERLLGSASATPDFSGGIKTRFGFAAGNSGSGQLTQYYDNFQLESSIFSSSIVPEPTSMAIFGLGGLFMAFRYRGRRKLLFGKSRHSALS